MCPLLLVLSTHHKCNTKRSEPRPSEERIFFWKVWGGGGERPKERPKNITIPRNSSIALALVDPHIETFLFSFPSVLNPLWWDKWYICCYSFKVINTLLLISSIQDLPYLIRVEAGKRDFFSMVTTIACGFKFRFWELAVYI